MSSTVNNGAASMPSPPDAANGFPQPSASSGTWPAGRGGAAPGLVKRAHREILDHERKRRVELKCMELQEMMEEQGYSEEEIRQKVGTFRQMLMEKEGVLTREDRPGGHIVAETPRLTEGAELGLEYAPFDDDDGPVDCDCPAACYRGHRGYRTKHWSSSSPSPPPKKKKKKKGGHRRTGREEEVGCGSSSPLRKKKKSGRKLRYRLISLIHARPHTESPGRRSHRHSSGSSHSPSLSSHYSDSRSPSRLSLKHRDEGRKTGSQRSSGSRSPSQSGGSGWGSPQRNGGSGQKSGAHAGRPGSAHSPPDVRTVPAPRAAPCVVGRVASGAGGDKCGMGTDHKLHGPRPSALSPAPGNPPRPQPPFWVGEPYPAPSPSSRAKERPPRARPASTSPSPGAHGRRGGPEGKSSSRSPGPHPRSWSSSRSPSKSRSPAGPRRSLTSGRPRRDKDGESRTRHSEAEAARARRRSRSYSPIRKRRRDSPSFMEPRRITSARKRPIPYYRPSPSSSSSCLSSDYSTRSHSRSPSPGHSHGSYSSRSHGTHSQTRSPSRTPSPSYHSRSSSESGGF
uniref:CWF21 domain-containing protein n=1 Tax=Nomascus leucogenys TaxID=61853 RepID=G1RAM1_NOMLE